MRGYAMAEALRRESEEIAREDRAELMREAATEIERLIGEIREALDRKAELLAACHAALAFQRTQGVGGGEISDDLAKQLECAIAKATGASA